MAKTNMIARDTKRKRLVDLHAAKRAELKKAGDSMGLQKLPKNSCKPNESPANFNSARLAAYLSTNFALLVSRAIMLIFAILLFFQGCKYTISF